MAGTIHELCPHPYDEAWDRPRILHTEGYEVRLYEVAREEGNPTLETFVSRAVGRCMNPLFLAGTVLIADPIVHAFSGSLVMIYRPWVRTGTKLFCKILQFLLDRWWLVSLDSNPPMRLDVRDTILGVVTCSIHPSSPDVEALEEEHKSLGFLDVHPFNALLSEAHKPVTKALAEKRLDEPRIPFTVPNLTVVGSKKTEPFQPFAGPLSPEQRQMLKESGIGISTQSAPARNMQW